MDGNKPGKMHRKKKHCALLHLLWWFASYISGFSGPFTPKMITLTITIKI